MADYIVPGHPLPFAAALPDHRMRDPVRGMHKIECVPALLRTDARGSLVHPLQA